MRKLLLSAALLAATAVLTSVPVVPQFSTSGLQLRVDEANAITYRRARVTTRRVYRRAYRRGAYYGGAYGGCRC